jgi:hypothetical protein
LERERVTVQEAARRLGITESAVRKRAGREQLRSEKVTEGKKERLYIFLDTDEDKFPEPFRERYVKSLEDRVRTLEDEVYRQQAIILSMTEAMKALSPPAPETSSEARESPETVEEERGGVEHTSYAVEAHGSSREATEAHEAAEEQQGRGQPHSATGGAQEGARRPWWRRVFGR